MTRSILQPLSLRDDSIFRLFFSLYLTHHRSHAINVLILHSKAFFYLIFEGIALGTQPLISFNTGAGLKERVTKFRKLAFIITLLIAVISVITL